MVIHSRTASQTHFNVPVPVLFCLLSTNYYNLQYPKRIRIFYIPNQLRHCDFWAPATLKDRSWKWSLHNMWTPFFPFFLPFLVKLVFRQFPSVALPFLIRQICDFSADLWNYCLRLLKSLTCCLAALDLLLRPFKLKFWVTAQISPTHQYCMSSRNVLILRT